MILTNGMAGAGADTRTHARAAQPHEQFADFVETQFITEKNHRSSRIYTPRN